MCSTITGMRIPNKLAGNNQYYIDKFMKEYRKSHTSLAPTSKCTPKFCSSSLKLTDNQSTRRSGNYKPTLWDFDRIHSLNTVYTEEKYRRRAGELVVQVKELLLLGQESNWFGQLELIDDLERLGLSYHFHQEIHQFLNSVFLADKYCDTHHKFNLYSTALSFRLLRQHGFKVSQDVFDCFKNEEGDFEASLGDDTKGLLQLYEASFLLTHGENTLEQARVFSTNLLQKKVDGDDEIDEHLLILVRHSLELPLHWRVRRPNARWFIEACNKRSDMNPLLLELAKLDFNIVQAAHQQELKIVSSWWKESKLAEKLPFARDRVVENYLWNVGLLFEPQYGYPRIMTTKLFILITVIDDVFDVYGTLEETQLFNHIIQRWDIEAIDELPYYMQICYLALDSFINEMAYHVLKEQGILIIQDLRKSWADLCGAYAKEAEWYHMGYKPTLEEYMDVAWISISAHTILSHVFFLITNPIEKEAAESLRSYHNIIRYAAVILRLADDLGTSSYEMKRGDVPKAVECYMNDTGASFEEAREHVRFMIRETWKSTNEERFKCSPFSEDFMRSAADLGRQAQYMYQHGDGHGIRNPQMEERIMNLIFRSIV